MVRRLGPGTFAALLLTLLALAAPAGAATGFAADETLSSAVVAGSPDVAMAPNGYAIAGWIERTSGPPVVRVSVRPPGGAWSPLTTFPVSLESPDSVSVAIASSGAAAVTWEEVTPPSTFAVGVATRAPGGSFTGAEVLSGVRQTLDPTVGVAADGTVTLLYAVNPDTVVRDFPAGSSVLVAPQQPLAASCSPAFGSGIAEAPSGDAVAPLYCSGASFALRAGGRWTVSPTVANDIQTCPSTSTLHTAVTAAIDGAGHPVGVMETDVRQPDFTCMGGGLGSDSYSEQLVLPLAGIMTPVPGTPAVSGSTFGGFGLSPIAGPQAAISPAGIVFTWGATDLSFRSQATARFFAADGSGGSPPQPVGQQVTGSLFPRLALAENGRGLLSWVQSDGAGSFSIEVAVREPGTNAFGAPGVLASDRNPTTPALAMDDAGDGVAAWTQGSSPAVLHVRGFDATAPTLSGVAIPASGTAGAPAAFSALPFDLWGPLTTTWSFGDGAMVSGAAVQHAYVRAGTFTASVTATDAVGNAVTQSGIVRVLASGGPAISQLSLTHRRFRVGRARTAVSASRRRVSRAPVGTTFRFALDRTASVKIAFARPASGLRAGRRCVKPSRRLRRARARRCTRLVAIRPTLTRAGRAGANAVPFSGRIGRRALAPGSYRATFTATASGRAGAPSSVRFVVVR